MDTETQPRHAAPDAEMAMLALIIENPKRFAPKAWAEQIDSEYFHSTGNGSMFKILMERIRSQKPVDPSSIKEDIRRKKPDGLTLSKMVEILNVEKDDDGWSGYMSAIRNAHTLRIIQEAAMVGSSMDGRSALDVVRKASERASSVLESTSAVTDAKDSVRLFLDAFTERYENGTKPGISTGIQAIDDHTGGMRKGELWVIGAKTSGGKSILMIQMASSAVMEGKKVAIFTLELGTDEIIGRMISCMGRIPISMINNPKTISEYYLPKIKAQASSIAETRVSVCDMADMTMDTISGHCIRLQETAGLDMVVIDYIQMVSTPRTKGQSREQEVASISRSCKQLAKRLRCPVITATQLNEEGKSRESRAIEHDADNVWLINHDKKTDETTVQAWKCRNGVKGTTYKAEMDGLHQSFTIQPQ